MSDTLNSNLSLGEVAARITFSNNAKGTHTATVLAQYGVTLIAGDSKITLPKQPVLGGVGGNPYIYFQFTDCKGHDLSEEVLFGRCVQGIARDQEPARCHSHLIERG